MSAPDVHAPAEGGEGFNPAVAEVVGLLLRMADDRAHGSVTVKVSGGLITLIEEHRTYKPTGRQKRKAK